MLVTLVFWALRYVWFVNETVPGERIFVAMIVLVATGGISMMILED